MRRCLCCFAMVLFLLLVCGPIHIGPLTVFPQWGQITFCRSTRSRQTCLLNGSTAIKKILLQRSQCNSCGCSGLLCFTPRSGIMIYPSSSGTVHRRELHKPQPFIYSERDFGEWIHRVGGVKLALRPKLDGVRDFARRTPRSHLQTPWIRRN